MRNKALISMLFALPMLFSMAANAETQNIDQETLHSKKIVSEYFNLAFIKRLPREAAMKYISPEKYIQHNPTGKDGRQALLDGFAKYISESNYTYVVKRIIAEGDLVVVHSQGFINPDDSNDRGEAVIDIFRVENDKIVEHWDVIQAVPETSANTNTMF
ncbi:nuclear transport factor 2 family protein [Idiomarina abyssalis]|uniref:nuclear transport factor 2 family protein n=1 Tax=Idiomarina abyssalis TaxID=86102 RepID=UPI003A8F9329